MIKKKRKKKTKPKRKANAGSSAPSRRSKATGGLESRARNLATAAAKATLKAVGGGTTLNRNTAAAAAEAAVAKSMGEKPGQGNQQDRLAAAESAASTTAQHLRIRLTKKMSINRGEALQAVAAMQAKWKGTDGFESPQAAAEAAATATADKLENDPKHLQRLAEQAVKDAEKLGINLRKSPSLTRREAAKLATMSAMRRIDYSKNNI